MNKLNLIQGQKKDLYPFKIQKDSQVLYILKYNLDWFVNNHSPQLVEEVDNYVQEVVPDILDTNDCKNSELLWKESDDDFANED